jgi:hypothetical protein
LFGSCIIHILNTECAKIWDLTRYLKQLALLLLRDSLADRPKIVNQTEIKASIPLLREPAGRIEHKPTRRYTTPIL